MALPRPGHQRCRAGPAWAGLAEQRAKKTKTVTGTVTAVTPVADSSIGELATVTVKAAPATKGGPTTDQTFSITKDSKLEKTSAKSSKKFQDSSSITAAAMLADIKVGKVLVITPKNGQAKEAAQILILAVKKKAAR